VELAVPVVAHKLTAEALGELAATDWSDGALDRRVAAGEASPEHAANVKEELPSPRTVRIAPADIVFQEGLDFDLGEVTVQARHVGGDHAADSSVMYVEPDRVLFLGDCLYEAPSGGYTAERLARLTVAVLAFDAELYVEGHSETVLSRAEIDEILGEASHGAAR
jgi:glyoxylase-like metal-dependent hydrolase (beta-lactamase superfamily II)